MWGDGRIPRPRPARPPAHGTLLPSLVVLATSARLAVLPAPGSGEVVSLLSRRGADNGAVLAASGGGPLLTSRH